MSLVGLKNTTVWKLQKKNIQNKMRTDHAKLTQGEIK